MNRSIKLLFFAFTALFLILILNLSNLQFFSSEIISSNQNNKRQRLRDYSIERGAIYTSDGVEVARSIDTGGEYRFQREYPQGSLYSNITGYDSWRYGRTGLEEKFNRELLGQAREYSLRNLINRLFGGTRRGYSIVLTVDSKVQQAAARALGDRRGAVVAIRPDTGEILAMVTSPRFDPNITVPLRGRDTETPWKALRANENKPLIDRCTAGLYPPGSSFKVVSAAAALETGTATTNSIYQCSGNLLVSGYRMRDYGGKAHGRLNFKKAFELSCNITFATIGLKLGATMLVKYAEKFGFNDKIEFDLPVEKSTIPGADSMDPVELASSSIGQGKILVTPLQMALVAAAIANGGCMPKPYIVREIQEYSGKVVQQFRPSVWKELIGSSVADTLTRMMVGVVKEGTGTAARIPGMEIAGKTGTAEIGENGVSPHSWFVCFGPASKPQVAVAVIVENGGEGGKTAAPIGRQVLLEAL